MRAHQIMTRNVISVTPKTSIVDAANTMLSQHISGLPVLDGEGTLVGIVSESDFLRRTEIGTQRKRNRWLQFIVGPGKAAEDFVHEQGRKVEEVMTPEPLTATEDTPLDELVQQMEKGNIKRIPIMRDDRLVGIVTRSNLLRAVASLARRLHGRVVISLRRTAWAFFKCNSIVGDGPILLRRSRVAERPGYSEH